MWPLGPFARSLLPESKLIEMENTIKQAEGLKEQRRQMEAVPPIAYHEFERPKNEAAVLEAAGDYMRKLLDIVWTGTQYVSIRRRSQELARMLTELSQKPLRFPARELTVTPRYLCGYEECSNVTKELIAELIRRDEHGRKKYGVNLDRTDLTLEQWLQHQKEENLDAAGYAEAQLAMLRRQNKEKK